MTDIKADATSRQIARAHLALLLTEEIPQATVYGYWVENFTESPVISVGTDGSRRRNAGFGGQKWKNEFRFLVGIHIALPTPDEQAAGSYTYAQRDDQLDELEKAVADVVARHRVEAGKWILLDIADEFTRPVLLRDRISGRAYLYEGIGAIAVCNDPLT